MLNKIVLSLVLGLAMPTFAIAEGSCPPIKAPDSLTSGLPSPKNFSAYSNFSNVINTVADSIAKNMTADEKINLTCRKEISSYTIYMSSEQQLSRICADKKGCDNMKVIFLSMSGDTLGGNAETKAKNALRNAGITEKDILAGSVRLEDFVNKYQKQLTRQFGKFD